MTATITAEARKQKRVPKVPDYLIKEIIDGIPVYYKGYRDVLTKKKNPVDIMADGMLQMILKSWIASLFLKGLESSKYWVGVGEVGSHISHKNNLAHDVAVFERSVLPPGKITNKYADVPARLIIEIDTEIEYADDRPVEDYVHRKTEKMLDFGTEKVIWIFTTSRKIMIAGVGKDWVISNWDKTVDAIEGVSFNIAQYLKDEGITLEEPE